MPHWLRVAAVFLGCVLLTGVAFAAMTQLGWISNPFAADKSVAQQPASVTSPSRGASLAADSIPSEQKEEKPVPVVKVFDNATLADILTAMSQYYELKIVFRNEAAKSIRLHFEWDQAKSIDDNIAILNGFQQITITRSGETLNIE